MKTIEPIQLTDAEWHIIRKVWELQPVSAVTVQEEMQKEKEWSYSTVKTMMDRMVEKGILTTTRIRNLMLYSSAISPEETKKSAITVLLERAFDGALSPMLHFLFEQKQLSEKDVADLEMLVESHKKTPKNKRRGKS